MGVQSVGVAANSAKSVHLGLAQNCVLNSANSQPSQPSISVQRHAGELHIEARTPCRGRSDTDMSTQRSLNSPDSAPRQDTCVLPASAQQEANSAVLLGLTGDSAHSARSQQLCVDDVLNANSQPAPEKFLAVPEDFLAVDDFIQRAVALYANAEVSNQAGRELMTTGSLVTPNEGEVILSDNGAPSLPMTSPANLDLHPFDDAELSCVEEEDELQQDVDQD